MGNSCFFATEFFDLFHLELHELKALYVVSFVLCFFFGVINATESNVETFNVEFMSFEQNSRILL